MINIINFLMACTAIACSFYLTTHITILMCSLRVFLALLSTRITSRTYTRASLTTTWTSSTSESTKTDHRKTII